MPVEAESLGWAGVDYGGDSLNLSLIVLGNSPVLGIPDVSFECKLMGWSPCVRFQFFLQHWLLVL